MRKVLIPVALMLAFIASASPSDVLTDFGHASDDGPPIRNAQQTPTNGSLAAARANGATWLVRHQHIDGGWSSGAHGTNGSQASSDVATTAFGVLALMRDADGSQRHRKSIDKGLAFVLNAVEHAPTGPRLRTPQGTQIQYKLGELVDTHLAALMLGEVAGITSGSAHARVLRALDTVVEKVALAQQADGSFDSNGWAPVLSTSIAASSLNKAVDLGIEVDEGVLSRSDAYQASSSSEGGFDASAGAGVQLYAVASALRTNSQAKDRAGGRVAQQAGEVEARAKGELSRNTEQLITGFGSLGGEEMLSYMMISDTLAETGGADWRDWQQKIGEYLTGIQNADGSWAGHHCITSQAFTTAGGVMTLGAASQKRQG
jgi:hypothetical protein